MYMLCTKMLIVSLAYASYSLVWQEYKRMGQIYNDFIDRDTISGIQFGYVIVFGILWNNVLIVL